MTSQGYLLSANTVGHSTALSIRNLNIQQLNTSIVIQNFNFFLSRCIKGHTIRLYVLASIHFLVWPCFRQKPLTVTFNKGGRTRSHRSPEVTLSRVHLKSLNSPFFSMAWLENFMGQKRMNEFIRKDEAKTLPVGRSEKSC